MEGEIVVSQPGGFDALALALDAIEADLALQESTRHQYRKAILNAAEAGVELTDPRSLGMYARTVGSSTRAFLSAVIAKLTQEIEQQVKSVATPENIAMVQAAIYRAEALRNAVTVEPHQGQKAHTWLSQAEVKRLLDACTRRASGEAEFPIVRQRDRLAIGLMVGAGLRRAESVGLRFDDVKLQPIGGHIRTVLDVLGKGAKNRVVPISDRLANLIDQWATRMEHTYQQNGLQSSLIEVSNVNRPTPANEDIILYNLDTLRWMTPR